MNQLANTNYMNEIADNIVKLVQNAKEQLATSVNSIMTETYWNIGKYIVEVEQDGKATAVYGSKLLTNLSHELTLRMGKGYSRPNLNNMRKFYLRYPNCQTVSDNLSWSHICELITIDDDLERQFYENECIKEKWDASALNCLSKRKKLYSQSHFQTHSTRSHQEPRTYHHGYTA